jgi:hypothetical protein
MFYRSASLYHPQRRAILHLKNQKRKIKDKNKTQAGITAKKPRRNEPEQLKAARKQNQAKPVIQYAINTT